jgi:hypothetical protein
MQLLCSKNENPINFRDLLMSLCWLKLCEHFFFLVNLFIVQNLL